jgi:hypothetical protein
MAAPEFRVTKAVAVAAALSFLGTTVLLDALEPRLMAVVVALLGSRSSDSAGLRGDGGGGGQSEKAGGREEEGVELHDCCSVGDNYEVVEERETQGG